MKGLNTGTEEKSFAQKLKNKVAIITGAGSGIGAATAMLFAKEGAHLLITGNHELPLKETLNNIRKIGCIAAHIVHDVTNETHWKIVVQTALSIFGKIDILVNNAGITGGLMTPLEQRTTEEFNLVLQTNLTSQFLGMKSVSSCLVGGASIVNVSSIAGITGNAGGNAYTASKGGSRMLSKGVAIELAPRGIRVNSLHPGYVETPMVKNMEGANEFEEMALKSTPLQRGAAPIEIAQAILFLASEDSSFITGAEIIIDGGFTTF